MRRARYYTVRTQSYAICTDYTHRSDQDHEFRLVDVNAFHTGIVDLYQAWVYNAPHEWKTDGFLENNIPISIAARYGQNQPLLLSDAVTAESNNWLQERNYTKIRYMTIAIATHIRSNIIESWPKHMLTIC